MIVRQLRRVLNYYAECFRRSSWVNRCTENSLYPSFPIVRRNLRVVLPNVAFATSKHAVNHHYFYSLQKLRISWRSKDRRRQSFVAENESFLICDRIMSMKLHRLPCRFYWTVFRRPGVAQNWFCRRSGFILTRPYTRSKLEPIFTRVRSEYTQRDSNERQILLSPCHQWPIKVCSVRAQYCELEGGCKMNPWRFMW